MPTPSANGDSRLSFWLRVREFAVPPSMIDTATARRSVGDWAGACAAAGVDVDLNLRSVARDHGQALVTRLRSDLRRLAPDLLRWHLPRIAPDGLLRPGLTIALARYGAEGQDGPGPVHLVVRTPPAWADGGQRISLALWDGTGFEGAGRHPHPRPGPRFRLDLHRHLWDASRAGELRARSGADRPDNANSLVLDEELLARVPHGHRCALDRWAAEAGILLRAEGRQRGRAGSVLVRLGSRHRLVLEVPAAGRAPVVRLAGGARSPHGLGSALPVLPDAATWVPPDLELLRSGAIDAGRLHPLVAAALTGAGEGGPSRAAPRSAERPGQPRLVECRGARHRIGLVDGVLAALDHDPAELRREELLVALTGTPLPCLRAIDEAHRRPDCLTGVRERLDHGDIAGALAVVEGLLGPGAHLRDGPLRDELEAAAQRRITYGLFRAGLIGAARGPARLRPGDLQRGQDHLAHPRHASLR
ncbi:hypothetical protein ACIRPX_28180 [Streptomyces sp. NPDC101225]|uniref:hypothetical protein n=1 Tax=Streptomyces sp. NPDC101225 TaxID=3366135 RepID=UPI0037FA3B1B